MPQWLPGSVSVRNGGKHSSSLGALQSVRVRLACLSMAVVLSVMFMTWSRDELPSEFQGIQLREDASVARFSAHCGAPRDGTEGMLISDEPVHDLTLHSAVILGSEGDTSAVDEWPEDRGPAIFWDCEPQALPRYWRLNKHVEFVVVNKNGVRLERSFTPDLLPDRGDEEQYSYRYPCGPGQLTAAGFQQAVGLGKHFADAYGDLAGLAVQATQLEIRSVDTKASLATAVGILMALLAAPRALHALPEGAAISIQAQNFTSSHSRDESKQRLGAHLLARWCHQLPWPCSSAVTGSSKCISLEEAAAIVQREEVDSCRVNSHANGGAATDILKEIMSLLKRPSSGLAVVISQRSMLTAVLHALLGKDVCLDPLLARPPLGSHFVVERWSAGEDYFWRALWNGVEITHKLPGCDSSATTFKNQPTLGNRGCEERVIETAFLAQLSV